MILEEEFWTTKQNEEHLSECREKVVMDGRTDEQPTDIHSLVRKWRK